jgi:hypothetical protein
MDVMIKLSNYNGLFVVQSLELRRAALLEMTRRLSEQSRRERAVEFRRLDAVLMQIKAELPQITELIDVSKGRDNHDRPLEAAVEPFVAEHTEGL